MKQGATDKDIFDAQYKNENSDGRKVDKQNDNINSLGKKNVGYYSPKEKKDSKIIQDPGRALNPAV